MTSVLGMRGPPFLALYAVIAAALCAAVWLSIRRRESEAGASPLRVRDPYEIAYLRGGTAELVKVAVVALLRRGLLEPVDASLQAAAGAALGANLAIERAILAACRTAREAGTLAEVGTVEAAARAYHRALVEKRLVPDAAMLWMRIVRAGCALALLGGFALLKIAHALATGHANVELLIGLVGVAAFVLFKIATARRTADGDRVLRHLNGLFDRVKRGPRPADPEQLHEALLLAAVYGDYSQSGTEPAIWRRLFPVAQRGKTSDGGSSSSGSSCGSGCGGGGGCGGCGS